MRRREVPAPLMARSVPGGSCIIGSIGSLWRCAHRLQRGRYEHPVARLAISSGGTGGIWVSQRKGRFSCASIAFCMCCWWWTRTSGCCAAGSPEVCLALRAVRASVLSEHRSTRNRHRPSRSSAPGPSLRAGPSRPPWPPSGSPTAPPRCWRSPPRAPSGSSSRRAARRCRSAAA